MRRSSLRCWSLAATALLVGPVLEAGPALAQCEDLPSSSLHVFVSTPTVRAEVTPPGIADGAGPSGGNGSKVAHPGLRIGAKVVGRAFIERRVVERDGKFCAAPREVAIRLGVTERVVHLPSAGAGNRCVRETLLAHARQHAELDDRIIREFVSATRASFMMKLADLKKMPADDSRAAFASFSKGVIDLVNATVMELNRARHSVSDAIEAHADHTELARSCGGALHDIVWPSGRAHRGKRA